MTEIVIKTENDLKKFLHANYMKQVQNFFGDEKQAMKFLSSVMASVQKTPKLLECKPMTIVNSFMTMAQLGLMPSNISGEAYVLPYKNGGAMEAQFQLGYQGIVTLLYGAGAKSVVAEQVRKNDVFSIVNGSLHHEVDPFKSRDERGDVIGAYAIIYLQTGGKVEKFMRHEEILAHAKQFSKSFSSEYSPWNSKNDPEGWMPRKTVLKQAAKLAPKNEKLNLAIAEDNKDSIIAERLEAAKKDVPALQMGNILKEKNEKTDKTEESEAVIDITEGNEEEAKAGRE